MLKPLVPGPWGSSRDWRVQQQKNSTGRILILVFDTDCYSLGTLTNQHSFCPSLPFNWNRNVQESRHYCPQNKLMGIHGNGCTASGWIFPTNQEIGQRRPGAWRCWGAASFGSWTQPNSSALDVIVKHQHFSNNRDCVFSQEHSNAPECQQSSMKW